MASEFFSNSNGISEDELRQIQEAQYISFLVSNVQYGKEYSLMLDHDFDEVIQVIRSYMKNKIAQLKKRFDSSELQELTDLRFTPFGEDLSEETVELGGQEEQFDLTVAHDVSTMITVLSSSFLLNIFEFEDRESMLQYSKMYLHKEVLKLENAFSSKEELKPILDLQEKPKEEFDFKSQSESIALKNLETMNQILRVPSKSSLFGKVDLDKMRYVIMNYSRYQNKTILNKYSRPSNESDIFSDFTLSPLAPFGEEPSSRHK